MYAYREHVEDEIDEPRTMRGPIVAEAKAKLRRAKRAQEREAKMRRLREQKDAP